MAYGETKEEALKEIEVAKELWIETAKKDKVTIPEPQLLTDGRVAYKINRKISPVAVPGSFLV